jgi:hypothetical protein
LIRQALIAGLLVFASAGAFGVERGRIPFWPNAVPEAIQAHVDGVAALETVRELARFHRVQGSAAFAAAAGRLRQRLLSAGLADARIESFPADGTTRYAHFRSYLGWNPSEASLEEVSPHPGLLARFPDLPVSLADYSQHADVTAEVIDVGSGATAADYGSREVRGRIALASGPLPAAHRLACEERGAAGLLSDFPNQTTAWSGDDRDLVRWGHLSPYQTKNTFAFMLSKRQSAALRARLADGEKVVLRAYVRARMVPASYDVVSATIPGTEMPDQEVLLTAHLCHQSPGANDNASGSAAILEVARALRAAIGDRALPAPRRTIRFLWLPEIAGSQAWLVRHPELAARAVAGIHMDMVGGLLSTTHGTFHLSRSAETLPHVVNEIARAWLTDVVDASARYSEHGGDPRRGLVWLPGSRESFLADLRKIEMGSDHQVFEEGSFRIPMVYFHDWPDVTIHTNKDLPENVDATKLGRVAYLGAGIAWTLAALPDEEAGRLLTFARSGLDARAAAAEVVDDARDDALRRREAQAAGRATLESISALWPTLVAQLESRSADPAVPPSRDRDPRVPIRDAGVRGPVSIYYYDHLREALGPSAETDTALTRREDGELLAYEALNLVDGQRSVSDIRDILAGRYEPVPVGEIAEYLALLARAGVVRWKAQ